MFRKSARSRPVLSAAIDDDLVEVTFGALEAPLFVCVALEMPDRVFMVDCNNLQLSRQTRQVQEDVRAALVRTMGNQVAADKAVAKQLRLDEETLFVRRRLPLTEVHHVDYSAYYELHSVSRSEAMRSGGSFVLRSSVREM